MLHLSGAVPDHAAGHARALDALSSGAAWATFLEMVEAQGGDRAALERPDGLERAPVVSPVRAARSGMLAAVDTFAMGELVVGIGGGRRAVEDAIDPRVGLMMRRRIGDPVKAGDVIAELHLAREEASAVERLAACFTVADGGVPVPPLVIERVDP